MLVENKTSKEQQFFGRTNFMSPVKFQSDNCKQGELVKSIKGNKPSPTFALVGDDRIPEGVKLITK